MKEFSYLRASSADQAREAAARQGAMVIAGGTTLLDLAKCGIAAPETVVDITFLSGLDAISSNETGVTIGALAKMSEVAEHRVIREAFPAISQSLSLAASAQLRNMATIGGNLLQRTRCPYFRDPAVFKACNKREPGSGCSAIGGMTRNHAVLGTSEHCIAVNPGDLAVALVAFDAVIHLGARQIAVDDFFLTPGNTPHLEHKIERGELITAIFIPASQAARRSIYLKVRDRQSYEFAAASAAVGLELEEDGKTIRDLRVALGGVATKPWRARAVERALVGKTVEPAAIAKASVLAIEGAIDHGANRYKIDLAPRVVARAIERLGGLL
ncbi:xanthine dehydrogenase family protein subunit M [Rhizobium sp. SEMIA 4085]|uniref:Xanthine dehydrogenase YagS FAD-binding subunit protein n=1 Tax=Rhizobium gallicum bv. gallicum R602sp TaxID=1041138 RepID=A0A0B4XH54_9HYPH|nr:MULTISPECIES: xanthine dehydrogenase family protein subunit M [Rhizobium]AJD46416.1 xanthine dehydrogenase YagS FAD-binding subunit protein [Rhizobium gallicum bv. gallicum R602sp]NNH28908.1 xanthine dehydrogenase family protein subunit M [Rhizobium sp. SEMIA 4085]